MPTPKECVYPLVARRLKEALEEKNMSAQELSNLSGIGKSSISHYVNGTHCPNNFTAIKLANILKVKPEWLMGIEGVQKELQTADAISDVTVELIQHADNPKLLNFIAELLTANDEDVDLIITFWERIKK